MSDLSRKHRHSICFCGDIYHSNCNVCDKEVCLCTRERNTIFEKQLSTCSAACFVLAQQEVIQTKLNEIAESFEPSNCLAIAQQANNQESFSNIVKRLEYLKLLVTQIAYVIDPPKDIAEGHRPSLIILPTTADTSKRNSNITVNSTATTATTSQLPTTDSRDNSLFEEEHNHHTTTCSTGDNTDEHWHLGYF